MSGIAMRFPTVATNNSWYTRALAALPAATGSVVSVLLVVAGVWAVISLALRRYPLRYIRSDRFVVIAAVSYTLVMVASTVLRSDGIEGLGYALKPLIFLTIVFIIPRYRATPQVDCFGIFVRAAPWCGILALPFVAYQGLYLGGRVEAAAGNAYPFSMIFSFFAGVTLLNLRRATDSRAALILVATLSFVLGILLAETRAAWVAFVVNLVIAAWYLRPENVLRRNRVGLLGGLVVLFGVVTVAAGPASIRFEAFVSDVSAVVHGEAPGESVAARLSMWSMAMEVIEARPVFGYGANRRHELLERIDVVEQTPNKAGASRVEHLSYTHFHDGFLTAMVDAGAFGLIVTLMLLISPLALAVSAPRDDRYRERIAFSLFLVSTYAITGLVNILFGQDLIDALFSIGCIMVALSVGTGPMAARDSEQVETA